MSTIAVVCLFAAAPFLVLAVGLVVLALMAPWLPAGRRDTALIAGKQLVALARAIR